ncbi:MAG: 50S ribosomal protein L11 methyltransferase [Oleiphilaceae bacterium]|nr:50S ribosomal protein L11 methyltransferase [Oleiphilaceae bacterium]
MNHWIQLRAQLAPNQAEAFEEALLAAGASAVTLLDAEDQPMFEPPRGTIPLWEKTIAIGLFSAEDDMAMAREVIQNVYSNLCQDPLPAITQDLLENEDWTRKWIENFKPMQFGQRLWICPSWCNPPEPEAVNLLLDPGLAFGTGTHATTALCLEWLESHPLDNKLVIDFGCGSGILAIGAVLLGANKAVGIDNDPQAVIATRDNAQRNQLSEQQVECYLPEDAPPGKADILVANILAQPLYDLKETLASYLKQDGDLVLSGILADQAEALRDFYAEDGLFAMSPIVQQGDWVRLHGKKLR